MKFLQAVVDNSTVILGLLTTGFGLLSAFGLEITSEQVGAAMTFAGALISVLGVFVTMAKRQVVTLVDNSGTIKAGPAAAAPTGTSNLDMEREAGTGNLVPQVAVKPDLLKAA